MKPAPADDTRVDPGRAGALCVHVLERASQLFVVAAHDIGVAAQPAVLRHRLAPDMFDLARQAIVLSDSLVGAAALLAGRTSAEEPAVQWVFNRGDEAALGPGDDGFDAVIRRLDDARARVLQINSTGASHAASTHADRVVVERPGHRRRFDMPGFVERYLTPNAYFHLAMIHALLRASGARLGKADFEGPPAYVVDP